MKPFNLANVSFVTAALLLVSKQVAGATGTRYDLTSQTIFETGCFAPCACPILARAPVKGSFVLTPRPPSPDPLQTYDLTEIDWVMDNPLTHVTGSGIYRNGGEVAQQQQLVLDLSVDSGPIQHFDSAVVSGGQQFPSLAVDV